ncbi:4-aminobutyrate aminotransferase [Burkholderia multivorans]|nr:4-aminobutyrate--2-oxoglutarate transaminase [Burkholderia multivorans]KWF73778.1 4-aminobutyrate aminotransferase [Burkholderia multivorans]KWF74024.1 4-aminobutyrate aminotransferase [Burkholderia multivorans]
MTNEALQQRRLSAVARGINQTHPIYAVRAENERLWDASGNEYIDFTSGISVLNTGHLHPDVVQAIQRQLEKFSHTCFAVVPYEPYISVCEILNQLMPGTGPNKTALFSTGGEAVENAVKIARAHTRRNGIIAFSGAYHGRTLATLALTAKIHPYSTGMGLMPGNVYRARYPDDESGTASAIESIERIFESDAAPEDIAAIIFEPVQGEGGIHVAPRAFLQALRTICNSHGIVMIADEIQSGMGRTGTFFAIEQLGVSPDLIVFGKSIAAGLPLSGVTGRSAIVDAIGPGGLGGTYAGNPISCAAALAVLDVMARDDLLARATKVGGIIRSALLDMQTRYPFIAEVRGLGALLGVDLREPDGGRPVPEVARSIVGHAREQGLLLLAGGQHGNVLRILAPLTIGATMLRAGLDKLESCMSMVSQAEGETT